MVKEITVNKNTNNINGVFSVGEQKFFYKLLLLSEYRRELEGHNVLKSFYPVGKLVFQKETDEKKGLLIFEYEESVDNEDGLLIDLFANEKSFAQDKQKIVKILDLYQKVFVETIKKTKQNSSKIFFEDRIKSRLQKFYDNQFVEEYTNTEIDLNDFFIKVELRPILHDIKKYFSNNKTRWSVISQCDPNDLNIATKPVLFDYLAGGYNPIMAEFAVFLWYNLVQGSYLSPLYNKSLIEHQGIYKKLDVVSINKNEIIHNISEKRKSFIVEYIDRVLTPVLKQAKPYDDWYDDFKNYFSMKILTVFDVTKMSEKDKNLSLAYLQLFYKDFKIDTIEDLKRVIIDL